jgi:hypothetical protein
VFAALYPIFMISEYALASALIAAAVSFGLLAFIVISSFRRRR